jgi:hypothetical protein
MPNHEWKLYHPDDSDNDLRRAIRATGMCLEVEIWKTLSLLDVFLLSLFSLSSLDLGPVQIASARVFTTFGVNQVEVDFPRAPDPPKGCH